MTKREILPMTKAARRLIKREAELCINSPYGYVFDYKQSGEGDRELVFTLDTSGEFLGNMFDCGSLQSLHAKLKEAGLIKKEAMTFWVGMRDGDLVIWSVA